MTEQQQIAVPIFEDLNQDHLINQMESWRTYKPEGQYYVWNKPLSLLEETNKTLYKKLTEVQMAEQCMKLYGADVVEVKTQDFDGMIPSALRRGEQFKVDTRTTFRIRMQLKDGRTLFFVGDPVPRVLRKSGMTARSDKNRPSIKQLNEMGSDARDQLILNFFKRENPTVTLMTNRLNHVGAVGTAIAEGIYSLPILRHVEDLILQEFKPDEIDFRYTFLGYMDGVRLSIKTREEIELPKPIGKTRGQLILMTRNDFNTALTCMTGLFRDICLNGMIFGDGGGFDKYGFDVDPYIRIIHKTNNDTAFESFQDRVGDIGQALRIAPRLVADTPKHEVNLKDALDFIYPLKALPKFKNLKMYDTLHNALKNITKDRTLTLWDVLNKVSEVSSERSPLYQEAKWNDIMLETRFLAGQALDMDLFMNTVEENRVQMAKDKARAEAKKKAEAEAKRKAEEKRQKKLEAQRRYRAKKKAEKEGTS